MLCDQINEGVREKENTERLEWMQTNIQLSLDERLVFNSTTNFMGSRKLLHCGKLFKVSSAVDVCLSTCMCTTVKSTSQKKEESIEGSYDVS